MSAHVSLPRNQIWYSNHFCNQMNNRSFGGFTVRFPDMHVSMGETPAETMRSHIKYPFVAAFYIGEMTALLCRGRQQKRNWKKKLYQRLISNNRAELGVIQSCRTAISIYRDKKEYRKKNQRQLFNYTIPREQMAVKFEYNSSERAKWNFFSALQPPSLPSFLLLIFSFFFATFQIRMRWSNYK